MEMSRRQDLSNLDSEIFFRLATQFDRESLFRLRNDPDSINMSLSAGEVTWDDHCEWFDRKISDETVRLFVSEHERYGVIGVARFDPVLVGEDCLVSISMDRSFRGQGVGHLLVSFGLNTIIKQVRSVTFVADVKVDNAASISMFRRLHFKDQSETELGIMRFVYFANGRGVP